MRSVEPRSRRDDTPFAARALHEQLDRTLAGEGDLDHEVLQGIDLLAGNLDDPLAILEACFPGRGSSQHVAQDGGLEAHASREDQREGDQREQRVHDHACRPEQRALSDRFAPQALLSREPAIRWVLACDHHVSAEWHGRQPEVGAAPPEAGEAGAKAEGEDLDVDACAARGEEVAAFVDEDQQADPEDGQEDAAEVHQ